MVEGVPVQVLLALHMLEMVELVVRAVVVVMEVLEAQALLDKVMLEEILQVVVLEVPVEVVVQVPLVQTEALAVALQVLEAMA